MPLSLVLHLVYYQLFFVFCFRQKLPVSWSSIAKYWDINIFNIYLHFCYHTSNNIHLFEAGSRGVLCSIIGVRNNSLLYINLERL